MFETNEDNLTPISQVGEFKFIDHVTAGFQQQNDSLQKGVGDDAAVYDVGNGESHVVTTDFLIEGIHFDLRYVPLKHLGYKSVAVNLSDVFAMNAKPFGVTISVAMSNRFTLEAMEAFYDGARIACEKYGVDLLGGDTSSSTTGLLISVTAIGKAPTEKITYRSGAKNTDLICVSGDLGAAYAGLQLLEREKQVFLSNPEMQPDLSGFDYVVGRQLKPDARGDIIAALEKAGIQPTSMIDISDGLASELHHLARNSNCGVQIFQEKLPIDHQVGMLAEQFNSHQATWALNGGEDYELLFTVNINDFVKVQEIQDVFVIGHINHADEGLHMINPHGSAYEIKAQGWTHFGTAE